MNKKRLLKLADFLDTVPSKNFYINEWINECGTVACAVGWATTIPSFRRAGLTMASRLPFDQSPLYKGYYRMDAAAEFFGLGHADASNLFSSMGYKSCYPRPKTVAKAIRAFVAR